MIGVLKSQPVTIVVILIIILAICFLIIKNRKDVVQKAALVAVTKAQEAWGSDMGKVKFADAYSYLKCQFPIVTFFISKEELTKIINESLDNLKQLILAKAEKDKSNGVPLENMTTIVQTIVEQTGRTEDFKE